MTKDDMMREMDRLSHEFEKFQEALLDPKTEQATLQNKDLINLFASLHQLMQSPLFFEILFSQGFNKSEKEVLLSTKPLDRGTVKGAAVPGKEAPEGYKKGYATLWSFNSSILPLLRAYEGFGIKRDYESLIDPFDGMRNTLFCQANGWTGTKAQVDRAVINSFKNNCPKNESFLGYHKIDVNKEYDVSEYEATIRDLINSPSDKATALFMVFNGSHTESVFFIKNGKQIEALVATGHDHKSAFIHPATEKILKDNKIPRSVRPNITVIHDGNCTVSSELNINAVLYEARHCNNSVYESLTKLKNNNYSSNDYRVQLKDITSTSQSGNQPDSHTLTRLIAGMSKLCLGVGSQGWIEFCKAKKIHPRHGLKNVRSLEWESFLTPDAGYNWEDPATIYENLNLSSATKPVQSVDRALQQPIEYKQVGNNLENNFDQPIASNPQPDKPPAAPQKPPRLLPRNQAVTSSHHHTEPSRRAIPQPDTLPPTIPQKPARLPRNQAVASSPHHTEPSRRAIPQPDTLPPTVPQKPARLPRKQNSGAFEPSKAIPVKPDPIKTSTKDDSIENKQAAVNTALELLEKIKRKNPQFCQVSAQIDTLRKYGKSLNSPKGTMIQEHADNLDQKIDNFLLPFINKNTVPTKEELIKFKKDFNELLHSKDKEMSQHSQIYKPIIANILITVVGLLIPLIPLIVKACIAAYKHTDESKIPLFNKALFFASTKSQDLTDEVSIDPVESFSFKK